MTTQTTTTPVDQAPPAGHLRIAVAAAAIHPDGVGVSGTVEAIGADVEDYAPGDAVIAELPGGTALTRHVVADAARTADKPGRLSDAAAAAVPIAATLAYDLTHDLPLGPGQTLVVLGAHREAGLMAGQIGAVHKFATIGVAPEGSRELVEATGATFVADGPGFVERVRALLPDGADVVADLIGGDVLREGAALAKDPSLVVSAVDPTVVDLGGIVRRTDPEAFAKITGVVAYGLVDPHVTATFPLADAPRAADRLATGAAGSTVIELP